MAKRTVIATETAPKAVGPYSQAIKTDNLVFTAGQIPLDPATMNLVGSTVAEQTHQALKNVKAVLEAAGTSMENAVKLTVFMVDLGEFQNMNAVYAEYFPEAPPARSAFQVTALPLGALVEIECVAVVP
ncbi:MAG: RidA family protein [bacterium]|nr:RidA family protein [bacterium]